MANGKKVKREVFVDLTENEIMEYSKTLGELGVKLGEVEREKKEAVSDFNEKISILDGKMQDYFIILKDRRELKTVECTQEINEAKGVMEFYYNGVMVDTRPLRDEDMQNELPM